MPGPAHQIPLSIWLAPVVILTLGLFRLPYGYYVFLRLVVCAAAGFVVWQLFRAGGVSRIFAVAFALLALLYNPIFPVRLTRETWAPINVLTACLFGAGAFFALRRSSFAHQGGE